MTNNKTDDADAKKGHRFPYHLSGTEFMRLNVKKSETNLECTHANQAGRLLQESVDESLDGGTALSITHQQQGKSISMV
jgi:hypothetical protein